MPHARQRKVALILTLTLAAAIVAMVVVPGLGHAQDATPVAVPEEEGAALVAMGEDIYNRTCIACHQPGGTGAESAIAYTYYPPLAGNPFVTLDDPTVLIQTVLFGRGGMPSFRGLSDEEVAGVLSYVRQAWENDASLVDPVQVSEVRAEIAIPAPPPATPFPTELAGAEGTPDIELEGTPPGVQVPEAPRETQTPEAVPTLGQ